MEQTEPREAAAGESQQWGRWAGVHGAQSSCAAEEHALVPLRGHHQRLLALARLRRHQNARARPDVPHSPHPAAPKPPRTTPTRGVHRNISVRDIAHQRARRQQNPSMPTARTRCHRLRHTKQPSRLRRMRGEQRPDQTEPRDRRPTSRAATECVTSNLIQLGRGSAAAHVATQARGLEALAPES